MAEEHVADRSFGQPVECCSDPIVRTVELVVHIVDLAGLPVDHTVVHAGLPVGHTVVHAGLPVGHTVDPVGQLVGRIVGPVDRIVVHDGRLVGHIVVLVGLPAVQTAVPGEQPIDRTAVLAGQHVDRIVVPGGQPADHIADLADQIAEPGDQSVVRTAVEEHTDRAELRLEPDSRLVVRTAVHGEEYVGSGCCRAEPDDQPGRIADDADSADGHDASPDADFGRMRSVRIDFGRCSRHRDEGSVNDVGLERWSGRIVAAGLELHTVDHERRLVGRIVVGRERLPEPGHIVVGRELRIVADPERLSDHTVGFERLKPIRVPGSQHWHELLVPGSQHWRGLLVPGSQHWRGLRVPGSLR